MTVLPVSYYLVEAAALPDIIKRVAAAQRELETGTAATIGEAVRRAGVSRSAFYKYRTAVRPFFDHTASELITLHMVLDDAPGVLSGILGGFAAMGANILTINQSIPVNSVASVTVTARTGGMTGGVQQLIDSISALGGVTKLEIIAG